MIGHCKDLKFNYSGVVDFCACSTFSSRPSIQRGHHHTPKHDSRHGPFSLVADPSFELRQSARALPYDPAQIDAKTTPITANRGIHEYHIVDYHKVNLAVNNHYLCKREQDGNNKVGDGDPE